MRSPSAPTNVYNRTQIFCTIGAYVGALLFPQQRVLPSPCAATIIDGSVVPRRRRCSIALQKEFRVLAAAFFYGVLLWHRGTIRFVSSASFCPLFLAQQKKWVCEATVAVSLQPRKSGESGQKGRQSLRRRTPPLRCQPEKNSLRPAAGGNRFYFTAFLLLPLTATIRNTTSSTPEIP